MLRVRLGLTALAILVLAMAGCVKEPPAIATLAELTPERIQAVVSPGPTMRYVKAVVSEDLTTENPDDRHVSIYLHFDAGRVKTQVKSFSDMAVAAMSKIFSCKEVMSVAFFVDGDFLDNYGNPLTEPAVKLVWHREQADKVNWENLRSIAYSDFARVFDLAGSWYIHPIYLAELAEK